MVDGVLVDGVTAAGELEGADDEEGGAAAGGAATLAAAAHPSVAVKIMECNLSMAHSATIPMTGRRNRGTSCRSRPRLGINTDLPPASEGVLAPPREREPW